MHLTSCVERKLIPPFGLSGGEPGKGGRLTLLRDGVTTDLDGKLNLVLQRDDVITVEMCGGGGFGTAV
jgi:N-methylhydantoinase B